MSHDHVLQGRNQFLRTPCIGIRQHFMVLVPVTHKEDFDISHKYEDNKFSLDLLHRFSE